MTLLQRTLHQAEILDENPDLLEWYLDRRGPRLAEFLDRSSEFFEWYLGRGHQKGPLEKIVDRHPEFISSYLSHHNRSHAFGRVVEKHPKLLEDYLLNRKPAFEQFADNHPDYIKDYQDHEANEHKESDSDRAQRNLSISFRRRNASVTTYWCCSSTLLRARLASQGFLDQVIPEPEGLL